LATDGVFRQKSLDANLVDNINFGRMAFLTAETNMAFVKDASKKIYNKVGSLNMNNCKSSVFF
jgi:hypothetical protein